MVILYALAFSWLVINVLSLRTMKGTPTHTPKISVLIPLRNEEARVPALMTMLQKLDYPTLECILYNDASTDETSALLTRYADGDSRFRVIHGTSLPEGWRGKPHACHQLSKAATGELFVWLDADVTLTEHALYKLVATMERTKADAYTGFPRFQQTSLLEQLLTPLLHFFVHFHLPIVVANKQILPAATAASGAFIAVTRRAYMASGGHAAVREEVIEDVALFRRFKHVGARAMIGRIANDVSCEMYGSNRATWQGFQKNIFKAFGERYVVGLVVILVYSAYVVAPFIAGDVFAIVLLLMHRVVSDWRACQLSWRSVLLPASIVVYCALLAVTMWKTYTQKPIDWKGRPL